MKLIVTHFHSGRSIHPFCNKVKRDPLQTECTDDRNSVALCNLVEHPQPLPKQYQNFDYIPNVPRGREEYYGGSVSLADYCPYNQVKIDKPFFSLLYPLSGCRKLMRIVFTQEFTWRANNSIVRGSHCLFEDNNPRECIHNSHPRNCSITF